MIFGHKPFGVFKHDAVFLVPQMISFVEDLPDEWSEKWQNMKDGLVESDDGNLGEYPSLTFTQPSYLLMHLQL